jgi:Rieske Fe-S protein
MEEDPRAPEDPSGTEPDAAPSDPETVPESPDRRAFLIGVIGGGITLAIAGPSVAFVAGSATASQAEKTWIPLGSASSVEPRGAPTLMKARVSRRSGYLVEEAEISVWVITDDGSEFTVLSNVCTHLGCRVRWVDDEGQFFCPCHNGVFDRNGEVVSGPPPRPLDRFENMVEDDQILFKEGRSG